MPIIEVDDVTAAAMQSNGIKYQDRTGHAKTAQTIAERVAALESGPHRAEYLRLLKQQFPDMVVPEIDAAKPVIDKVDALNKRFDDYLTEQQKQREERETKDREDGAHKTVAQGRSWLRSKQKLDDEGVKSVESVMQDRGIADYEAAYHLWRANQPPPAVDLPSSNLGRSLDWFKEDENQPDKALLLKDPLAYRSKRAGQILSQIRAGTIDEFGRPINRAA
jgi:hypothetical protein